MDIEERELAVNVARGRAYTGLALLALPGLVGRLWLGRGAATPAGRALVRTTGARDLALGVGALTSLRETDRGPDWLSMGAVTDGVDALVCLLTPGLPRRARLVGLVAGASAVAGYVLARRISEADEAAAAARESVREAEAAAGAVPADTA